MTVRVVDEGKVFAIHGEDRAFLAQVLGKRLEWREDGVVVWSLVGHLRLPSQTTLVIRSAKAPLACVISWAAYVDPALSDLRNIKVLDDVGDSGDVGAALARVFCATLLQALSAHGQPCAAPSTSPRSRGRAVTSHGFLVWFGNVCRARPSTRCSPPPLSACSATRSCGLQRARCCWNCAPCSSTSRRPSIRRWWPESARWSATNTPSPKLPPWHV